MERSRNKIKMVGKYDKDGYWWDDRFDCEVCGSAGHSTGECDGYDEWIKKEKTK